MKAGIFLDVENLSRCGGWGMRYTIVRDLVSEQGAFVLRANAYMAIDLEKEKTNIEYRKKKEEYRNAIRREGFHLIFKEVKRYRDSEDQIVTKANADLDLAVDALLQAENLDYVLLGSGDGDFLRLVRALQSHGKRVDLLSFSDTSTELRHEVDYYFSGYLVPGLLPPVEDNPRRMRGIIHSINEEKRFAFLTVRTGLGATDLRHDVLCHIKDLTAEGHVVSSQYFSNLKTRETIIEFDLIEQDSSKPKAVNATEFIP